MTIVSAIPLSSSPPPPRPYKSKLRTLSSYDYMPTHPTSRSFIPSTSPTQLGSISTLNYQEWEASASSETSAPSSTNYKSRFKEYFDLSNSNKSSVSATQDTDHLDSRRKKGIVSNGFRLHSVPVKIKAISENNKTKESMHEDTAKKSSTDTKDLQLRPSVSTPLQKQKSMASNRKYSTNESLMTVKSASSQNTVIKASKSTGTVRVNSLNRAEIIIDRLESWLHFIDSLLGWLQEMAKISTQSSRLYSNRAYPFLLRKDEDGVLLNDDEQLNHNLVRIQTGLQALTMQIVAEEQEFSRKLDQDYLPILLKLRKECKSQIHKLKADSSLNIEDWLKIAEITKSKMTYLSKCCEQADSGESKRPDMDPWMANLLVLRQLKREVEEENRLRVLMIPIQKEACVFETNLLDTVTPIVQYCFEKMAPNSWNSTDKENVSFKAAMDQLKPDEEWAQFRDLHKKDFVDEQSPHKNYLKINYPNKFHPLVMTIFKGKMERKYGVRKQYLERNYVITQGGYLHEFKIDDKVLPVKSYYIPTKTIIPSVNPELVMGTDNDIEDEYEIKGQDKSYTFEICRPASTILQQDKVSIFRVKTKKEFIMWCRLLIHIASGSSLSHLGIGSDNIHSRNSSHNSKYSQEQYGVPRDLQVFPNSINNEPTKDTELAPNQALLDEPSTKDITVSRSIHSTKSEESFNEPAIMNTKDKGVQYRLSVHPPTALLRLGVDSNETRRKSALTDSNNKSSASADEEFFTTDSESFVTANFSDDSDEDEIEDPSFINDYFQSDDMEDDNMSVESNSTAKGYATSSGPPASISNASPSNKGEDDSQSSIYFSSNSAPASPISSSASSIVSIPEIELNDNAARSH
ncbi:hypothetical protein BDB01DRAFT_832272 [Pilobolus umbonatus]|nr:hypothetical protein BDB01DRAFT_832272 [Pilobolus umbonatus]